MRRVLIATAVVSAVFSVTQSWLEFKMGDRHLAKYNLYAHGGMLFLMVTSAVFVIVSLTFTTVYRETLQISFCKDSCMTMGLNKY